MFKKKQKDPSMVTGKEKVAFAFANLGNIPLMTLLSSYLMLYYTTVLDMDPGKIATMFLLSKVMDGISDPVTGFLIDRFPSGKMGKFRPILMLGSIICSINYILLWFGPAWIPGAKYAVAYITYLLLGWTFDLMDIPLNSLLPVMTDNLKQRNTLSLIKSLCYGVGMLAVPMIAPQIVANATLDSYYMLIFSAVAIVVLCTAIGALGIKERVKFKNDEETKYSFKELLKFFVMGPVLCFFIVDFLVNVAGNMLLTAGTYFYTYIMGDLTLATSVTALTAIGGNVMYIFVLLKVPDKFGKRKVAGTGIIIAGIAYIARLLNPTNYLFLVLALNVAAFGIGFETLLKYSIQADNTNYVEYKTGKHAESAIASLSSFSTKIAQGIGGAIPGYVLSIVGWKGVAEGMSDSVLNGILACNTWIPGLLYLGAGVIMFLCYKLDGRQLETINESLKVKHANEMSEN